MKFRPVALLQIHTLHQGTLGTPCDCWPITPGLPPGGLCEEIISGPDADGLYTSEFRPIAPRSVLERNKRIADYIMTHKDDPDAVTVRAVARATGIPHATVARSDAWLAFVAWRESGRIGELRTIALTDAMLACVAARTNEKNVLELIAEQEREGADDYYPPETI